MGHRDIEVIESEPTRQQVREHGHADHAHLDQHAPPPRGAPAQERGHCRGGHTGTICSTVREGSASSCGSEARRRITSEVLAK